MASEGGSMERLLVGIAVSRADLRLPARQVLRHGDMTGQSSGVEGLQPIPVGGGAGLRPAAGRQMLQNRDVPGVSREMGGLPAALRARADLRPVAHEVLRDGNMAAGGSGLEGPIDERAKCQRKVPAKRAALSC